MAVGKSTTARILQALLARWPDHPQVDLVTTDGFLFPNRVLEERGLMERKGFPESYDLRRLVRFLADVKSGQPEVRGARVLAPHLRHRAGEEQVVRQPDIVIVEGLDGAPDRRRPRRPRAPPLFVSDFFDFSIYVDADEADIEQWYLERFLTLRETAFADERSFFHHFAALSRGRGDPGRPRASGSRSTASTCTRTSSRPASGRGLILEKAADHSVRAVRLRKL